MNFLQISLAKLGLIKGIDFSPVLRFIYKPVICFAEQSKWLVSVWYATLDWNGLIDFYSPTIIKNIFRMVLRGMEVNQFA